MSAWKDLERRIARSLGGERTGPAGRAVSDVVGTPWSVEVKRSKGGVPERRMLDQAIEQGRKEGKPWLLVVARHGDRRPIVTMEFSEFLRIAGLEGEQEEAA